jgi:hypothetical protein
MDMLKIATDSLTERLLNAGMDVVPEAYRISGRRELSSAAEKLARGVWSAQLSAKDAEEKMRRLAQFQFGVAPLEQEAPEAAQLIVDT